jgi:REP element-mobilizing transposase RayT
MSGHPIAYHLTFGTYGTRLHGDQRGTVIRAMNRPGDPIIGRDEDWERIERSLLNFPPVVLSEAERLCIESHVLEVCERRDWTYHMAAGRADHVHVLLSAPPERDAKAVRRWLKTWLGQVLSDVFPGAIPRLERDGSTPVIAAAHPTWWAEGGSIRWVWTREYYDTVFGYIVRQRTTGG